MRLCLYSSAIFLFIDCNFEHCITNFNHNSHTLYTPCHNNYYYTFLTQFFTHYSSIFCIPLADFRDIFTYFYNNFNIHFKHFSYKRVSGFSHIFLIFFSYFSNKVQRDFTQKNHIIFTNISNAFEIGVNSNSFKILFT